MTDPLGSSQVIPYLRGLARKGHEFTLISCEKPERLKAHRARIEAVMSEAGIDWHPITYHKKPPILSTLWDLNQMKRLAFALAVKKKIQLVHCRSYIPSLVGLQLKRKLGLRFLFDMRGFWADERVDGALWNLKSPHYRLVYRYFKKMESCFLKESDQTISLTHAGKNEMKRWGLPISAQERITVIPCCADLAHFDRTRIGESERAQWRSELKLESGDFVVSYLGSLGTWYLLDEMLDFFKTLKGVRSDVKLLFITPDEPRLIFEAAARQGISSDSLRIREATRVEVPGLLAVSNLGLFFIRPSYSKISSSPTKMAELLAMGVPIVTNTGVGDSDWLSEKFSVGSLVKSFDEGEYRRVAGTISALVKIPPTEIRAAAQEYFSLESGIEAYHKLYSAMGGLR
jgi:glycosyltransferase involved in cell wall biosynthesis